MSIYADYNGTSQLKDSVKQYLIKRLDGPFGNPNAIHSIGNQIKSAYEKCRVHCAEMLGAEAHQVIFNSGSSEGISQVFYSHIARSNCNKRILTSKIEHSAIRNACKTLDGLGFQVDYLDTDSDGKVIIPKGDEGYCIAALMAANNETGVIQDYEEFAKWCESTNTPYFCDTTQLIGKTKFNFKESNLDFAILSAHKIGALGGCGILLVKKPEKLKPIIFGGGQEYSLRGGTQNYIGVECLTVALQDILKCEKKFQSLELRKNAFEKEIKHAIPEAIVIGEAVKRLPNTTLLSIPGIHGQALQIELESRDIFVTTSSACSDNEPETSAVLKSMGIQDDVGRSVVRISVDCDASEDDYSKISDAIIKAHKTLKKIKIS